MILCLENLITYQSDISYDGRVSMTDLAYLNAGAGAGKYARDVDVNYDGEISIADLAQMDKEWGSSLHTTTSGKLSETENVFTGTNGTDTIDLDTHNLNSNDTVMTNNTDFINQNEYELTAGFIGTLAQANLAGYTDSTTSASDTGTLEAVTGSQPLTNES